MSLELALAVVICVALLLFATAPLRRGREGDPSEPLEDAELADLQARKEALYRQIRDAELDRAQGKLSDADWRRLDAELRRAAVAVLKRLAAAEARRSGRVEVDHEVV